MRNLFMGLDADQWEAAEGLPVSPYGDGEPLTVEDVKAGIVAMLRRLDEQDGEALGEWVCEECRAPWTHSTSQCQRCGNRTRLRA